MNKNVEARNHCPYSKDEKEDDFSDHKVKIEEFQNTSVAPNRKDDKNSLYYSIYYVIRFIETCKLEKCGNEELKHGVTEGFF